LGRSAGCGELPAHGAEISITLTRACAAAAAGQWRELGGELIKATTPTEDDCEAVSRTWFTPQAIRSAYNVGPLHQAGWNGKGITITIVDSYGSDTMAHDLHVFNQAKKSPVRKGGSLIPEPTVEWPASDTLVTGVRGTASVSWHPASRGRR
jgi:hypothetical protein